jgi:diguanylate cyclase (GGDEF)-like protein
MGQKATTFDLARCLDAAVALTRHSDPQELTADLLGILRTELGAEHLRLLAISNDERHTEFHEGNAAAAVVYDVLDHEAGPARPLAGNPHWLACVRSQRPVEARGEHGAYTVVPLHGAQHVWALLVIDGPPNAVPYELLDKLLRVFSNQMFMLSRSQHDPLTGLYNRQSFYERIRRADTHAMVSRRAGDTGEQRGNCFALLDIDNFKEVNDRYGHLYGDEVLLLLARLMIRSFRHQDMLFRYGGEEFAAVLINADLDIAERMLERFRAAVAAYSFPRLKPKTISIGFTTLNVKYGVDKVVMCADKALYYAKNHGRNKVCCYEKLVSSGEIEPVVLAEGEIELF